MDKVRIFGEVIDSDGMKSTRSITVSERNSEVISDADAEMMFKFACWNANVTLSGAVQTEYVEAK